jgi:peroxiredoxin
MKTLALTLIAALALFAGGANSNRRAPGFSLMDSHFEQHDIQDYLGKVVLVDFMQTGCIVCNSLADNLVILKSRYGDKLAILSIVTLPDSFDTAEKFAAAHKSNWPIVFDSGQVMMSYLKLKPTGSMNVHFPHIFVVDKTGVIRNDFDGAESSSLTIGGLSAEIEKLLK